MLTLAKRCMSVLLTAALVSSASAQHDAPVIHVAVLILPPVVLEKEGTLTGFYVDLWNEIAARLDLKTQYLVVRDSDSLSNALRSGKSDLTMPQFITWERDQEFDFSYPVLEAGQQVMVLDAGKGEEADPLIDLLNLLWSRTTLVWLAAGLVLMLIPAHIVWFLDRGREDGVIPSKRYFPGIFHGLYWAATTLVTQAEQAPRQWFARVVAFLFMFVGIVFVAFYTATLTSNLTIQQLYGDINGPDDLPGRRVGTGQEAIYADYLRNRGVRVRKFDSAQDAFQALMSKQVDAVFFASPVLNYYATHDWNGKVRIVGPEVYRQDIAFVFPNNSPLRKKVDGALLALRKDGTYDRLYGKWFGNEQP